MQRKGLLASPAVVVALTGIAAFVVCLLFMTVGVKGDWGFVLAFRGTKLAALVLVAFAVSVSTVLFQTVTGNRILTPAVMGFDSLYVLLQTVLVFFLGGLGVATLDQRWLFVLEVAAMVLLSSLLFRTLFSGGTRSLHLLLLVGILCGGLFRSLAGFIQRIIDPNEFVVLQDRLFANFNSIDVQLLGLSAIAVSATTAVGLANLSRFDVLSLGRETAIDLGLDHRRMVTLVMALVAVLVSVSTALVGPVTFFGLLVANLAYLVTPSFRHRHVLPVTVFLSIVLLAGGQMILERLFAFSTALSIVIEFFGGLTFILLLMRGKAR
ncbi:iron chelate uptake ABC transporter family permease subunit [Rhizobium sp. S95]|uniref:Iron chelate uptake ABC transporter family permease subunit n=1 Tax=Ciceribacter sichuanensis TaxID=2949647 RepID=A0AAJ1BSA3_9HYPH|nr:MULTISPECIES: iron chelate uptake ABC transporter family permease subunit [unclassified Ciceribacter]MCM2394792.1 iron chelate uptake ABC transporter family permease subunit [Ciceribacter sp. S95]MCO5955213.1 iron chelate uptake ABC transporter family permease subunit [Ciceribacter sp. S101]